MDKELVWKNMEDIRELLNLEEPDQKLGSDYAWFVGAMMTDKEGNHVDYSDIFINQGIWENGWDSKYTELVNSIKVGDKIAIKASYTKKGGLPFNSNGKTVGVMAIKAIGIVADNPQDGKHLKVDWERVTPVKEWYGKGVLRNTIHLIKAEEGLTKKLLLKFVFDNIPQDYSLCEEQYADDIEKEPSEIQLVTDSRKKELSLKQLARILEEMYNGPAERNKTTAVHMFGLKYGESILENNYASTEIVKEANINASYHAEVSKGVRLYEAILNNEYGVSFYNGVDLRAREVTEKEPLPVRKQRENRQHPLNSIIYGPPGTGKTYSTINYALAMIEQTEVDLSEKDDLQRAALMDRYTKLIDEGRIVFTTFHQNYGYEDFIQGLRPDTRKEGISFELVDGVFKRIADKALFDDENNYVIIIDEINRANISKVFGELITLIEDDKRWGEVNQTCATLPSGEPFAIPNNLYILGTMNSSDKSISLIDAALRRRFDFIEQKPNANLIKDPTVNAIFIKLNERLASDLDSTDLLMGHSFFMNKQESDLPTIFNNSVVPLLYEYYFDNRKKVAAVLTDVLKGTNYKVSDEKLGRIRVKFEEDDNS